MKKGKAMPPALVTNPFRAFYELVSTFDGALLALLH